MEIETRQQTLLDVITATKSNHIHPLLISPTTLGKIYAKTNPICQNCLPILYQTSEVQFHLLKDRLIVRIILPILDLPKMNYYQIRCYPVHSLNEPSTYLDIPYSYVAIQSQTQKAMLLSENENRKLIVINQGQTVATYITQLSTPLINADTTKECVIKMLLNPLTEDVKCPLKVQIPARDTIIQLNHKNTWLYSLKNAVKLQITCKQQFQAPQLRGQGILTIKKPCHIQIGDKTLYFQGTPQPKVVITQPNYFPKIDIKTQFSNLTHLLPLITPWANQTKFHLITSDDTNSVIEQGTLDLNEIQRQLERLNKPENNHVLPTTSLSLTSLVIVILIIYAVFKIKKYITCPTKPIFGSKGTHTKREKPQVTPRQLSNLNRSEPDSLQPSKPVQSSDSTTIDVHIDPLTPNPPKPPETNTAPSTPTQSRPKSLRIEIPEVPLQGEWTTAAVQLVN